MKPLELKMKKLLPALLAQQTVTLQSGEYTRDEWFACCKHCGFSFTEIDWIELCFDPDDTQSTRAHNALRGAYLEYVEETT